MNLPLRILLLALLAVSLTTALPAQVEDQGQEAEAAPDQQSESVEPQEPDEEFETIKSILEEEESMLQGAYAYEAGRRRDPFISLLRPKAPGRIKGGDCPVGCPIDEITLTGIFIMPEGPVAQMQSPDHEKSFLVRVGDEFLDGDVIEITVSEVRFRQIVNDPQSPKPFREVTKELSP